MATSLARLPVSSEGARNEIRQDTQEAEAVEQSEPGLVDTPGDPRRESTGSQLVAPTRGWSGRETSADPSRRIRRGITPRRGHRRRGRSARPPASGFQDGTSVLPGHSPHPVFASFWTGAVLPQSTKFGALPHRATRAIRPRGAFHVKRTTQRERFSVTFRVPRHSLHAPPRTSANPGTWLLESEYAAISQGLIYIST